MNVNFTERLIENLYESHISWKICDDDYQLYLSEDESALDQSNYNSSPLTVNEDDKGIVSKFNVVDQKMHK